MCFSTGCRKPNLGLRQAYSTFPAKRLFQELRREGRDRRRKVLQKMRKFDLSSLQASSTPPAWSSIVRINPPTWGQLKQVTRKAQQMVSNTGKPPSVANLSLPMLAVIAMQVYPAPAALFWVSVPHPPLHPMG